MNKTAIKNFAVWARKKLIADVRYRAGLVGITEQGIKTALPQSDSTTEFYDIGTATPYAISGQTAIRQRRSLADTIRKKEQNSDYSTAYQYITEEVAYTWFNRLIAVRFMEVNDYLPGRVRVLSSESGKIEPDLVADPFGADLTFTAEEERTVLRLKQDNQLDELFRLLLVKQCNALNKILPGLFEETDDYTELLLSVSVVDRDGVVYHLVHDIDEDDFNIEKGGQVEIIGWLYQYWNTEPKDAVFSRPSGTKIKKEEIPAATQLFTPDWIVRYMVENSLGRLWVEGHPNDSLKANWKYYLEEAEQEPAVQAQLADIRKEYAALNPEDLRCIDPCMGSGHILCYLFDVLMQIYESQGYSQRDAAQSIVRYNLYGLDIDKRATQLAYFSVMMKARQYDRRFFSRNIQPLVYSTTGDEDGENFGSLVLVDDPGKMPAEPQSIFEMENYEKRLNIWNWRYLLSQKYHVVCTNPPYMGGAGMNGKLSEFVKKNYSDSKSDLFSCFMERADVLTRSYGFTSLITMESWMFLSSFEKLRKKVNQTKTIINMVHMPYLGKGGTSLGINFGTAAVIMQNGHIKNYSAQYEYTVYYECDEDGVPFEFPTKNERWKTAQQENFSKIPGEPVAYWLSLTVIRIFSEYMPLENYYDARSGLQTNDNNRFLRFWYEIASENISVLAQKNNCKWFPHLKGGMFRRWYGNQEYVVNWENNGLEILSVASKLYGSPTRTAKSIEKYFLPGLTWTDVSTGLFSVRKTFPGFIFDTTAPTISTPSGIEVPNELLGFLNCKVAQILLELLAPTIHYNCGSIALLPIIQLENEMISNIVLQNIDISRTDWDSFETSWDFKRHPLIPLLWRGAACGGVVGKVYPTSPITLENHPGPQGATPPKEGNIGIRRTAVYASLPYNPKLKTRAKELRKAGNLAEVLLWLRLKKGQVNGWDFDRQKIIGNYIVDFYCANVNLVIEIDGSSHDDKQEYDAQRDAYLRGLGLSVLHFSDVDVKRNIEGVVGTIQNFRALQAETNHPAASGTPPKEGNGKRGSLIADAYAAWEAECTARFNQLKANEEELNRIFIDIYGLQDELTPEVEDKDVTVRRADLGRDIRSLLSYAVGCMFGRYSLDVDGLAYAGGEWDAGKYISFQPNADDIIPLTDEAYLDDDIVKRLCEWLRTVYGPDTLEENLDFIAKALGNKGTTSREIIRNYFLKDFFADHCRIYQKRPIYWLFDSGKQNGFKALIYLHRYTPDTIGKLRVDYLHRLQRVYASEIERMQDMIDNSKNPREVAVSAKRKEKLQKQLKECREYDEKIAHLALARIELDLDDGVKVNYEKVQTAADGKKYPVLGKI